MGENKNCLKNVISLPFERGSDVLSIFIYGRDNQENEKVCTN